ncbi:MAG: hypothetical protein HW416_105 [Chloroflexi bacterium]|nr:hypothetical protein [Chloroflexota bacterium]
MAAARAAPIPAYTEGSHLWYVLIFLVIMAVMATGAYQAYDTFTTQQSVVRQLTTPAASETAAETAGISATAADE